MMTAGGMDIKQPCTQLEYGKTVIKFYRHPLLLIVKNVDIWEREYEYCGDNYSNVPYLDRHPCAIEAKEVYDSALRYFKSKVK